MLSQKNGNNNDDNMMTIHWNVIIEKPPLERGKCDERSKGKKLWVRLMM